MLPAFVTPRDIGGVSGAVEQAEDALTPASTNQRRACLLALVTVYPPRDDDEEVSKRRFTLYHEALRDLPADVLWDACMECVRTVTFFPMPAEIRKAAEPMMGKRRRMLVQLKALRDYRIERPEPLQRLSTEEQARRRAMIDATMKKMAASAPEPELPRGVTLESAVIAIEGEPEVGDIATAILRARIKASAASLHGNIEWLKKAALADAREVWPFLERRGWKAATSEIETKSE